MNSSRSRTGKPISSITANTERSKRPSACAAAARCWEVSANRSTSSRLQPARVAIKSAPMPCGVKPMAALVAGSCDQAPPSEPMGTRDMLSTPPHTTRSSQPLAIFCAPMLTASRPEAQKRLICTPLTRTSQPALSKAVFGNTEPCSPTGLTQPMTTSSTSAGSKSWRFCS